MVEQLLLHLPQLRQLRGGEQIEEVAPHALDVQGRGRLERGEAFVGEHGERSASILGARLPAHPPELLEPGHRMRQAAPRRLGGVGELAHAAGAAGRLREHHQDLVVAERQARVALEVALDLLPEEAGAHDPAQPDPAFVGVEPPHPVPHGPDSTHPRSS